MRPSRGLPPLECSRGVSPRKAANSRPLENAAKSWIVARSAVAVTGPIPGMVISRLAVSSALADASSVLSIASIASSSASICRTRGARARRTQSGTTISPLIDAAVGQLLERVSVRNPLRGDHADLRQKAAQGVERRRALPDHELASAMAHQRRLVLHRAHGNEELARSPCRLAIAAASAASFLLRRT